MVASPEFLSKAKAYWTAERLQKVTHGKKLLLLPHEAPELLRTIGILNKDASMSADAVRKYLQINHMVALLLPVIEDLAARFSVVGIADLGCGKSYLSFCLAHLLKHKFKKSFVVLGIDQNEKLITKSHTMAQDLGFGAEMSFLAQPLSAEPLMLPVNGSEPIRPHLMVGLHACDTATDFIIASALRSKADAIAVAPCCQGELARKWSEVVITEGSWNFAMMKTPHFRREFAAHYTDLMRFLLMRAHGYKTTATEFVDSEHSHKNRLIVAERKGNYLESAKTEYESLCHQFADQRITLDYLLSHELI